MTCIFNQQPSAPSPAVAQLVLVRRMKHALNYAALLLLPTGLIAGDAPTKVTVDQLLTHPQTYDGRQVDVSGYYTISMEDSDLWPDAQTAKRARGLEGSIYIDPLVWDPSYRGRRSKDVLDADQLTRRRVRVVGTFRAGGVRPRYSIPPDGPTIVNVIYFRPLR